MKNVPSFIETCCMRNVMWEREGEIETRYLFQILYEVNKCGKNLVNDKDIV